MEATDIRGKLILQNIPSLEAKEKITNLLAHYFKSATEEKLAALLKKTPVVISKNISQRVGEQIAEKLRKLGAAAEYVPEIPIEAHSNGTADAHHTREVGEEDRILLLGKEQKFLDGKSWKTGFFPELERVNKEIWLILTMLLIVVAMNYLVTSQKMLLGLYFLPTIFSAYYFGRRHATLTAFASICLVVLMVQHNPKLLSEQAGLHLPGGKWYELVAWGSMLVITAYTMGTLYEHNQNRLFELRKTYHGLVMILRQFISKDKYTENHCYRVSIYAVKIASNLNLPVDRIEDVRTASMLHDLGKLDVSRELLYKAAQLTQEDQAAMAQHVDKNASLLETVSSPLGRILPIILAHHEKYDGSGYYKAQGDDIPLEARIISVADVYDALTSDRPYRKAMSPFDAKEIIEKGAGNDFDPVAVKGFLKAFKNGEMDVPSVVV